MVYADGIVDAHEELLMRKLSFLLDVKHERMIAARNRVRADLGIE